MSPPAASASIRSLTLLCTFGIALGFSGCASTYRVKVDALCNPDVRPGAAYQIVPKDAVKADFEPRYIQAVTLIESALATKGYHPATTPREAEIVIEVDFGTGSRRKRAVEDVELFGIAHAPLRHAVVPPGSAAPRPAALAPEPASEPVPVTRVTVITFYEKYLSLSARETPRATQGRRKPMELWRVSVAVEDSNPTVDECLPALVRTAADNIGTTTEKRTEVRVSGKQAGTVLATN